MVVFDAASSIGLFLDIFLSIYWLAIAVLHPAVLDPAALLAPAGTALSLRRVRAVPRAVPAPPAVPAHRPPRPQPDRRAPGARLARQIVVVRARLTEGRGEMTYTPVELRHVRVGRRPFGYDRAAVEQILERCRRQLRDGVARPRRARGPRRDARAGARAGRQREQLLTQHARRRRAAPRRRCASARRREAELIVSEAHAEARVGAARRRQAERERLLAEVRRIEVLLRAALGCVGDAAVPPSSRGAGGGAARPPPDRAPPRPRRRRRRGRAGRPTSRPRRPRRSCPAGRRCGGWRRAARTSTGATSTD